MNLVNTERTRKAALFNIAISYENNNSIENNSEFRAVLCDEPSDPNMPSLKFKGELYVRDLKSSNPYF